MKGCYFASLFSNIYDYCCYFLVFFLLFSFSLLFSVYLFSLTMTKDGSSNEGMLLYPCLVEGSTPSRHKPSEMF